MGCLRHGWTSWVADPGAGPGEGVLELAFDRDEQVRGAVPSRPRPDHNPLNRQEYLPDVARRQAE